MVCCQRRRGISFRCIFAVILLILSVLLLSGCSPNYTAIEAEYAGEAEVGVVLDSDNPGFTVYGITEDGERSEITKGWKIEEPVTLERNSIDTVTITYNDLSCEVEVLCSERDYTKEAFEIASTLTENPDRINCEASIFNNADATYVPDYWYKTLRIPTADYFKVANVSGVNQSGLYDSVVMTYCRAIANNGAWYDSVDDSFFRTLLGKEKPATYEEFRKETEKAGDCMFFFPTEKEIFELIEPLSPSSGTFDHATGNYDFTVSDAAKAAEELEVSEDMLGYMLAYNSMFCTKEGCFTWGENSFSYADTNGHSRWANTRAIDPDNLSYLTGTQFAFSVGDFSYYMRQLYKSYDEKYETACENNFVLLARVDEDGSVTKNISFMFANLDGTYPTPEDVFQTCWFAVYDWSGDESLTLATIGAAAFDPAMDLKDAKQMVSDLKKQADAGDVLPSKDVDGLRFGCSKVAIEGAYTFIVQKIPPADLSAEDFLMDFPDSNIFKEDIIAGLNNMGRGSINYSYYDPAAGDTEEGAFVTPRGIRYGATLNEVRDAYGYSSDYYDIGKLDSVLGSSEFSSLLNEFEYSTRFRAEAKHFLHYVYADEYHMLFMFNDDNKLTWIISIKY